MLKSAEFCSFLDKYCLWAGNKNQKGNLCEQKWMEYYIDLIERQESPHRSLPDNATSIPGFDPDE